MQCTAHGEREASPPACEDRGGNLRRGTLGESEEEEAEEEAEEEDKDSEAAWCPSLCCCWDPSLCM